MNHTTEPGFSVPQAARRIGVGSPRLRVLLSDGRLKGAYKDESGRWIIPASALEPFLARRQVRRALAEPESTTDAGQLVGRV